MKNAEIDATQHEKSENNYDSIKVQVRSNDGSNNFIESATTDEALVQAKQARTPDNYMVCIEVNMERTHRWDRSRVVGSNHWKKTNTEAMEVIGPIRMVS
ncbi:hypothetical protein [Shewanella glacialipiscicola]|uniref:type IV pilus biogenesis protein PilI n=1 Tax=Shewanella glacialipiscicola TaxID=614069 RepID=UPI003D79CC45